MRIREIANGIIVSLTDDTGTNQEHAFLFSDPDWVDNAKAFIAEQKIHIANHAETQAIKSLDRISKASEA